MKDIIFPITYKSDPKGLKTAESQLSGFGTIAAGFFAKIGASAIDAFARATVAVQDFAVDSVKVASSFQETTAAIGEVFGESSKQLEDFAKTASSSIGQSQVQFLQGAKTFGIFGKAAGLGEVANANFATTLNSLASDMASFNDTTIDDAITALGAALRGESEPIRRYGVLLDDATLKARAMEMGIYDGTGSLTQQQRVLAAYEEILAQTVTQQGDFTRTSEGLANSSRTLESVFENLQISVGTALLPALEAVVPQLTAFIEEMVADPDFNAFIDAMAKSFSDVLAYLPTVLENLKNFGNDVLPVLKEVMPFVNAGLEFFVDFLWGIEQSSAADDTRDFADAMKDLAGGFNDVTRFIRDLNTAWNNLPEPIKWAIGRISNAINPFTALNGTPLLSFNNVRPIAPIPTTPRGRLVGQANGGVTVRPGLSMIGEEGPEIMAMPRGAGVIPLDRIIGGEAKSSPTNNIVINITGGLDSSAAIGEAVVNSIRKYERTSGAVFARA
jgi:hypothetical protein